MRLRKFFALFFIFTIIFTSHTSPMQLLFDNNELTVYRNELESIETALTKVKIETSDTVAVSDVKKSFFKRKITVLEDEYVCLGGQTVGIAMYTNGLYVTDTVPVETNKSSYVNPALDAGIKKGDYILEANGTEINDVSNLDAILKASNGNKIKIKIFRNGKTLETEIYPVKSTKDGEYRLGMWLRDSVAGLGTITYIDPETKKFSALGHSVCDADTGDLLIIKQGRIVECSVNGVKKGTNGSAGELKGSFGTNARQLGNIDKNTKFGISGTMYTLPDTAVVPLGSKELVKEGEAYIYSDFENGEMKKYSIDILHVNKQTYPSEKSMVIKITDKNLIEKTGGIVQGLSGSPIVQDGKLIGAVTHVMINDPTKGYGIFIENMLETTQGAANEQLKYAS